MRCLSVSLSVSPSVGAHSDVNLWSFPFHQLGKFFYFIADSCELALCTCRCSSHTHTHTHADTRIVPWNVQITTSHTHTHTHMLRHINIFCCLLFKQSLSTNILVSCCCLLLFSLSPFFVLLLVTLLRSGHAPLPHICPTRATGRWCICQVFEKLSIRQREQLRCDVQAQLP